MNYKYNYLILDLDLAPIHEVDEQYGDWLVHPCVRYIPEGFEGHQWWMVYTPYYGKTDGMENPRLCYADAEKGKVPTTWNFYCIIKDKPEKGYNSDPTLIFHNHKLYVFWREVETMRVKNLGYKKATFGCYVKNKEVTYFDEPTLGDMSQLFWEKRNIQGICHPLPPKSPMDT